MTRRIALQTAAACLLVLGSSAARAGWFGDADWPSVKQEVRTDFPEVRQISVKQAQAELAKPKPPVLLDVRAREEYEVSHLANAKLTPNLSTALTALAGAPKDSPVVLYCAVGWRSSSLAAQLMKRGYTNVSSVEGSIFEWANEGLPVYRGSELVKQVHPYSRSRAVLLRSELRAPL